MDVLAKWMRELENAQPDGADRIEDVRVEALGDPRLQGDEREFFEDRCGQYLLDLANITQGVESLHVSGEEATLPGP